MKEESYEQLNQVVKVFETTLMMLQKVGVETNGMSIILQHMVCQRLDSATLHHWECHHNSKEVPTYQQLVEFLKTRCLVLRNITSAYSSQGETKRQFRFPTVSHTSVQQKYSCPFCDESMHSVFKCPKFTQMNVSDRVEFVKKKSLCLDCLSPGHIAKFCIKGSCQICGKGHHTLLHAGPQVSQFSSGKLRFPQQVNPDACQEPPQNQTELHYEEDFPNSTLQNQTDLLHNPSPSMNNLPSSSATDNPYTSHSSIISANPRTVPTTVLLPTAVLTIRDSCGNTISARALLDSGSQLCFMTERVAQSLKFERCQEYLPIRGIGQLSTCSTQSVSATIVSKHSDYRSTLNFFVLPKVTADIPLKKINVDSWSMPSGLDMADPDFQNPSSIDIILGAEVFYDLLLEGYHRLNEIGPMLQKTRLGWVVSGKVFEQSRGQETISAYCTEKRFEKLQNGFLEMKSSQITTTKTLEDAECRDEWFYFENNKLKIKTPNHIWEPQVFPSYFAVPQWIVSTEISMRNLVSDLSKLVDSCRQFGSKIARAKIFLQDLWKQIYSWTKTLPGFLQQRSPEYRSNLNGLSFLRVPWLFNRKISSHLRILKSRIAPLHYVTRMRKKLMNQRLRCSMQYLLSTGSIVMDWNFFNSSFVHRLFITREE
ncbi:uncharacterized protein LOC129746054 [Uranotaenia lowii]|uniref:uncharacterized protein LOC129746054 n=1 Tax=Uranotaenia lowii TaxID=190385 RepID=UPI0024791CF6|nr:uncharacterized protein LOC129746054 [Uranotaenia lowii]